MVYSSFYISNSLSNSIAIWNNYYFFSDFESDNDDYISFNGEILTHPSNLIIQSFTGLLDCNNKKIFEGDIIEDIHQIFQSGEMPPGNFSFPANIPLLLSSSIVESASPLTFP